MGDTAAFDFQQLPGAVFIEIWSRLDARSHGRLFQSCSSACNTVLLHAPVLSISVQNSFSKRLLERSNPVALKGVTSVEQLGSVPLEYCEEVHFQGLHASQCTAVARVLPRLRSLHLSHIILAAGGPSPSRCPLPITRDSACSSSSTSDAATALLPSAGTAAASTGGPELAAPHAWPQDAATLLACVTAAFPTLQALTISYQACMVDMHVGNRAQCVYQAHRQQAATAAALQQAGNVPPAPDAVLQTPAVAASGAAVFPAHAQPHGRPSSGGKARFTGPWCILTGLEQLQPLAPTLQQLRLEFCGTVRTLPPPSQSGRHALNVPASQPTEHTASDWACDVLSALSDLGLCCLQEVGLDVPLAREDGSTGGLMGHGNVTAAAVAAAAEDAAFASAVEVLGRSCPALRALHAWPVALGSKALGTLLAATPQLQALSVRCVQQLMDGRSFAAVPCAWQRLRMARQRGLHVSAAARLPLHSLTEPFKLDGLVLANGQDVQDGSESIGTSIQDLVKLAAAAGANLAACPAGLRLPPLRMLRVRGTHAPSAPGSSDMMQLAALLRPLCVRAHVQALGLLGMCLGRDEVVTLRAIFPRGGLQEFYLEWCSVGASLLRTWLWGDLCGATRLSLGFGCHGEWDAAAHTLVHCLYPGRMYGGQGRPEFRTLGVCGPVLRHAWEVQCLGDMLQARGVFWLQVWQLPTGYMLPGL